MLINIQVKVRSKHVIHIIMSFHKIVRHQIKNAKELYQNMKLHFPRKITREKNNKKMKTSTKVNKNVTGVVASTCNTSISDIDAGG